MRHEMGIGGSSAPLKRIFWGCFAVLVDVNIGSFDVLFDPIAYLIIGSGAADAVRAEPLFRRVVTLANISGVFALAVAVRRFRQQPQDAGFGLAATAEDIVDLSAVEVVLGTADHLVGIALVWYLFSAFLRLAWSNPGANLVSSLESARRWTTITLGVGALLWLTATATGNEPLGELQLVVGVATLGVGLFALLTLWHATRLNLDGAIAQPSHPSSTGRRLAVHGPTVAAVVLAVLGVVAVLYEADGRPGPATTDVAFALANGPSGLVTNLEALAVDVSQPRYDPSDSYDQGAPFGFGDDLGYACDVGYLLALDPATGERQWLHQTPRPPILNGIATLGDQIVVVDTQVGERLPSIAAIDAASGRVAWQHYVESPWVWPYGSSVDGETMVFTAGAADGQSDAYGLAINQTGEMVDRFDDNISSGFSLPEQLRPGITQAPLTITHSFFHDTIHHEAMQSVPVAHHHFLSSVASSWAAPPDAGGQILLDADSRRLLELDPATGDLRQVAEVSTRNGFVQFGDGNWPASPLQATEDHVLLLHGSPEGPDSLAEVFDRATGDVVFRRQGLRSAALVGDRVLYDVRTQADRSAPVTRTLYLAGLADPVNVTDDGSGATFWSADLSVNSFGGNGYLGSNVDGLVFLAEAEDGTNQFLTVAADGGNLPEVLRAGGMSGGGPSISNIVDDDLLVAATPDGVIWQQSGEESQRLSMDDLVSDGGQVVTSLATVNQMLVVQTSPVDSCHRSRPDEVVDELATAPDRLRFNAGSDGDYSYLHGYLHGACVPPVAVLSGVELAGTGDGPEGVRWSVDVPTGAPGLELVDDAVVVADGGGEVISPSVALVDGATGDVRWQRFIDAPTLAMVGASNGEVVVESDRWFGPPSNGFGTTMVYRLNSGGGVRHEFASPTHSEFGAPQLQLIEGTRSVSHSLIDRDQSASFKRHGRQLAFTWGRLALWTPATGERQEFTSVEFDEEWHRLGNPESPGDALQTSDTHSLVLLGSDSGPNSKAVIYSNATGQVTAEVNHIRSAALVGAQLLYDKRNEESADAESTRDLFLVSADDPDEVLWSTRLSVNDAGGNGFIGRSTVDEEALVFLVDKATGPTFITVEQNGSAVPPLLAAAGDIGGNSSGQTWIGDDLMLAIDGNSLIWQRTGGPVQTFDLPDGRPIVAVTMVDDMAVVRQQKVVEDCG